VEGKRLDSQVHGFVDALTQASPRGQLAKFHWAVCPTTVGLSEKQNQQVTGRLRSVAAAARVPVGPAKCKPNLVAIAVAGKDALLELLLTQRPELFEKMPEAEREKLKQRQGPVAAWHVRDLSGLSGESLSRERVDTVWGPMGAEDRVRRPTPYDESRIFSFDVPGSRVRFVAQPSFASAIILVELEALQGVTTTQLADYAALRAFARTDPEHVRGLGIPTILKLFDDGDGGRELPPGLTPWDLSFLKALYQTSNSVRAVHQRAAMKKKLKKNLERAQ
jgi:hypothetical protein